MSLLTVSLAAGPFTYAFACLKLRSLPFMALTAKQLLPLSASVLMALHQQCAHCHVHGCSVARIAIPLCLYCQQGKVCQAGTVVFIVL